MTLTVLPSSGISRPILVGVELEELAHERNEPRIRPHGLDGIANLAAPYDVDDTAPRELPRQLVVAGRRPVGAPAVVARRRKHRVALVLGSAHRRVSVADRDGGK